MKNIRDHLNEGFILSQDLEAQLHRAKLETNEGIVIDKEYNDIVVLVITKLPFSRWKTFLLKELRQEVLRKDRNDCNVKIENIVFGHTSSSPFSNEMNTHSLFLNKCFKRIISHQILFDKIVPKK